MNVEKLKAALKDALNALEEPICSQPISDLVDQTSIRMAGEDAYSEREKRSLHYQLLEAAMNRIDSDWFTEPKDVREAAAIMVHHSNGTPAKAESLARLMVAMCHWHGKAPTTFAYKAAVEELEGLTEELGPAWWSPMQNMDYMLFEEPSQAVFWRTCDYVTPHAALKEGAVYGTDDKVPSLDLARNIGTAVSEAWGHGNGDQLGIAFAK